MTSKYNFSYHKCFEMYVIDDFCDFLSNSITYANSPVFKLNKNSIFSSNNYTIIILLGRFYSYILVHTALVNPIHKFDYTIYINDILVQYNCTNVNIRYVSIYLQMTLKNWPRSQHRDKQVKLSSERESLVGC